LRNPSGHPVEAHFLGREIVFDVVVTREDGAVVWHRLDRGVGPSILQIRTLAPGESLQWRDAWLPREPGRFRVQGILPSDEPERRTPWVNLDVSP